MLTPRGWWLLLFILVQCALGAGFAPRFGDTVAVLGFVLLAWFLFEWGSFLYRIYFVLPKIEFHREILDKDRHVPVLWTDSEFDVCVAIRLNGSGELNYISFDDFLPQTTVYISGADAIATSLHQTRPAELKYRLKTQSPGEIRFEGIRIRIADRQGFFYRKEFIRDGTALAVLPRLSGIEGKRRDTKRINIFPPPGVHRLMRPGGGGELLDLRDYIPGDPPKMIAWKPSARRDKLFTKEYETEVPLRCTVFVDASESTRLTSGKNSKIAKIANLTAGISEAISSDRDHVGVVVFNEKEIDTIPPKRSRRHLMDILYLLSRACSRPTPIGPFANADALSKIAYPVANELYPELMDRKLNTRPFSMFWLPSGDTRRLGWVIAFLILPMFFCCWPAVAFPALYLGYAEPAQLFFSVTSPILLNIGWKAFGILLVLLALTAISLWVFHGLSGWMNPAFSDRLRRKQLGMLFATLDRDFSGAETHYLHDDQFFASRTQRFLSEHQIRYPVRLYDARGRYLFDAHQKIEVLAGALNYSIARGRDNELFVIVGDFVEIADQLDVLMRTVRVAIARHHSVIVIVPWQSDIPDPPKELPSEDAISLEKVERFRDGGVNALADELKRLMIERYHKNYARLRREFGKFGIVVTRAEKDEPVQMVLDRLNRLRGISRRR